jgi:mannose-6-phosphate isomerase
MSRSILPLRRSGKTDFEMLKINKNVPFSRTSGFPFSAKLDKVAGMEAISFKPLYMQRVWGGRELERVYGRSLPDSAPYGEAWEIVDREKEQSVVAGGPYAGKSLHELWTGHRDEIFGAGLPDSERFPILIKILDARDDLSIQVHPPVTLAASLGGEPKTEMWYIAAADPGAKLYVGLKAGQTRADFEQALKSGTVEESVHAIEPAAGDSIFIPSGRLHAIGAGFLIHEIQQNSDTTYRVFDWNRMGLDGKPRELHIDESMKSIDFNDFEPSMDEPQGTTLASCEYFQVDRRILAEGVLVVPFVPGRFAIFSVVSGSLSTASGATFGPGSFLLMPKDGSGLKTDVASELLEVTLPG